MIYTRVAVVVAVAQPERRGCRAPTARSFVQEATEGLPKKGYNICRQNHSRATHCLQQKASQPPLPPTWLSSATFNLQLTESSIQIAPLSLLLSLSSHHQPIHFSQPHLDGVQQYSLIARPVPPPQSLDNLTNNLLAQFQSFSILLLSLRQVWQLLFDQCKLISEGLELFAQGCYVGQARMIAGGCAVAIRRVAALVYIS